jgi:hypothetical protein
MYVDAKRTEPHNAPFSFFFPHFVGNTQEKIKSRKLLSVEGEKSIGFIRG